MMMITLMTKDKLMDVMWGLKCHAIIDMARWKASAHSSSLSLSPS